MKITNNTFDISSTAENNDIHYPVYIFTSLPYIYIPLFKIALFCHKLFWVSTYVQNNTYIYIQSVKLIMITYNKCAKLTRIQNIVCAPPQNWNQPLEDDDMRISVKH